MGDYPTRAGYYYWNGKWHPSKKTKREIARRRLIKEISEQLKLFPERYPYRTFVTSQRAAEHHGLDVWWQKCKRGHLVERKVTERNCPVCTQINRDIRKKRIKDGIVKLSAAEEVRLHEIYRQCRRITAETGIEHHVDHIRPLAAGGLHHPENLQIITAAENLSKSSIHNGKRARFSKKEKMEAQKDFLKEKRDREVEAREKIARETREELRKNRPRRTNFSWFSLRSFWGLLFFSSWGRPADSPSF